MIPQLSVISVQLNIPTGCSQSEQVCEENPDFKSILKTLSDSINSTSSKNILQSTKKNKVEDSTEDVVDSKTDVQNDGQVNLQLAAQVDMPIIQTNMQAAVPSTQPNVQAAVFSTQPNVQAAVPSAQSNVQMDVPSTQTNAQVAVPSTQANVQTDVSSTQTNVQATIPSTQTNVQTPTNPQSAFQSGTDIRQVLAQVPLANLTGKEALTIVSVSDLPSVNTVISDLQGVTQPSAIQAASTGVKTANVLSVSIAAAETENRQTLQKESVTAVTLPNSVGENSSEKVGVDLPQLRMQLPVVENSQSTSTDAISNESANKSIPLNGENAQSVSVLNTDVLNNTDKPAATKDGNVQLAGDNISAYAQNGLSLSHLTDGNVVTKVPAQSGGVEQAVYTQVTDNILQNIQEGAKELQLDLYPANLGRVSVKLSSQNGVLTVDILAANPKTQSMLMAGADDIKSILQATVQQSVQVTETNHNEQLYQHQNGDSQSGAYQQDEKQKNQQQPIAWFDENSEDMNTDDFLSMLEQVSMASSL